MLTTVSQDCFPTAVYRLSTNDMEALASQNKLRDISINSTDKESRTNTVDARTLNCGYL